MIVLGYSGLDGSVAYALEDPGLRPGEERMVQGLDSAAALLVDGRVVAAAAEERFSFEKHTGAFPRLAIGYCLGQAGLRAADIDLVAHGFDYGRYGALFAEDRFRRIFDPARQPELWQDRLGVSLASTRFRPVSHHLAHAASAWHPSGFDEALCVVCDGMGEVESLSVFAARDGKLERLDQFGIRDSLGILYGLVTVHLGFTFNADEYKVMGLAPYGNPDRFRPFFQSIVELQAEGRYALRLDRLTTDRSPHWRGVLDHLAQHVLPRPEGADTLPQVHCDFAAAAQECLERVLFHVLGYWRRRTGLRRLCMAGGVALNCTFNGKLIHSGLFDRVYVQPAAGDDGTALGAALHAAYQAGERLSPANCGELPFYGPAYSDAAMAEAARTLGAGLTVTDLGSVEAAADDAAQALHRGAIVAWFQGRMEYGPRALGSRSILANPLEPDIKERLNAVVKLREAFRPFAPAVAVERASQYFDFVPSATFDTMLATCLVRAPWRARLPGVTHVDGSARMQTVDPGRNPLFHRLITAFGVLSGVHCVVNTSFNLRGQPMIVSPEVAIDTFRRVRLDRLYLGRLRLTKDEPAKDVP